MSDVIQLYANANIRIAELERENAALREDYRKLAKVISRTERSQAREVSFMKIQLGVAKSENAKLLADKERLDWLESLNGPWPAYYDVWYSRSGSHDSLRDAIDANRKEAQP